MRCPDLETTCGLALIRTRLSRSFTLTEAHQRPPNIQTRLTSSPPKKDTHHALSRSGNYLSLGTNPDATESLVYLDRGPPAAAQHPNAVDEQSAEKRHDPCVVPPPVVPNHRDAPPRASTKERMRESSAGGVTELSGVVLLVDERLDPVNPRGPSHPLSGRSQLGDRR